MKPPSLHLNNNPRESLKGVLERIIYHHEENHFCIGEVRSENSGSLVVITGTLPGIQCGETLAMEGLWVEHPIYGKQFKIVSFESKLPSSVHGIKKYLSSGLIPGVGEKYAQKIVEHFKEKTLEIISHESARLKEVPGIGKNRAKAIKKSWDEQQTLREVFVFLKTYGVSTSQCLKLVKLYGSNTIELLKTNPYRLVEEFKGIGFKTADKIALNLGLSNESEKRIEAGVLFSIENFTKSGHTCCPQEALLKEAHQLLNTDLAIIKQRLDFLIQNQVIIPLQDSSNVQLSTLYEAEKIIAKQICQLIEHPPTFPPISIEKAIQWAQNCSGFTYAAAQHEAISLALKEKMLIITGGPGTGKTTILKALVQILKRKQVEVILSAPTGRAAQKMSEATGHLAQTLHRLLKYDPHQKGFEHNESNPLKGNCFIIDESSMLDTFLAKSLFRAIPKQAHVILVGDTDQLPSVGPGSILGDIIATKCVPIVSLNKTFRQQTGSEIVQLAHSILKGHSTLKKTSIKNLNCLIPEQNDIFFIEEPDPQKCLNLTLHLCSEYIPKAFNTETITQTQVLSPMRKGLVGIENLNKELQQHCNPQKDNLTTIDGIKYKIGDKVIQLKNNYEKNIFNGDLGIVTHLDKEEKKIYVNFSGNIVSVDQTESAELQLAYAISIHKSQGSEFPIVIIPLLKQHFIMLKRNLIYTAITRGKSKVFIIGDADAYRMAVCNRESGTRFTGLKEQLIS